MITGDINSGIYYRDLILEQIKTELKSSEDELQRMKDRLNKGTPDELERVYDAFERFGVVAILECIIGRCNQ